MPLYDLYGPFRDTTLTDGEQAQLEQAQAELAAMEADTSLERRDGRSYDADGDPVPDPMVKAHVNIAMARARAQLSVPLVMPEDAETAIRYPGTDPVGKFSIIDMKFAQREDAVRAALASRDSEVSSQVEGLLDACTNSQYGGPFHTCYAQMKMAAEQHRTLTRASKLCLDPEGRRLLHQRARGLESDSRVARFNMMLQGIEHMAGVRQGPIPQDIVQFYAQELKTPLNALYLDLPEQAARTAEDLPEVRVKFQDLDHKLLHQVFADPMSWGKSWDELNEIARGAVGLDAWSTAIPPYAAATAGRIVDPMFRGIEQETGGELHRGDLIAIDGQTVREIMEERFRKNGQEGGFEDHYRENVDRMTNELVAAGLMAGKRVEAFVPNKYGQVPKEPTRLVKTGYEPTPLQPEKFSRWQRFFAKRGFFKEKVARQAEYEKIMAARERMKASAAKSAPQLQQKQTPQKQEQKQAPQKKQAPQMGKPAR